MHNKRAAAIALLFRLGFGCSTSASLIGSPAVYAEPVIEASVLPETSQETSRARVLTGEKDKVETVCKPESESLSCKPLAVQMFAYLFFTGLALAIAAALCLLLAPAPQDEL
jgi:hypothetical protein